MANQLTSSGLTVGSGTITNFIPAFGSNVTSNGLVGGEGSSNRTPLFVKGGGINGYLFNNRWIKGRLQNHSANKCIRDLSDRNSSNCEQQQFQQSIYSSRNLGINIPKLCQNNKLYSRGEWSDDSDSLTSLSKEVA